MKLTETEHTVTTIDHYVECGRLDRAPIANGERTVIATHERGTYHRGGPRDMQTALDDHKAALSLVGAEYDPKRAEVVTGGLVTRLDGILDPIEQSAGVS